MFCFCFVLFFYQLFFVRLVQCCATYYRFPTRAIWIPEAYRKWNKKIKKHATQAPKFLQPKTNSTKFHSSK